MIHHDWPDQSRVERAVGLMIVGIVVALFLCWTCGCASLQRAWESTDEPAPKMSDTCMTVTAWALTIGSAIACGPCVLVIGPGSFIVAAASRYDTVTAVDHQWNAYCDKMGDLPWGDRDFRALCTIAKRLPPADQAQWAWYTYLEYEYGEDLPAADERLSRQEAGAFASILEQMKE